MMFDTDKSNRDDSIKCIEKIGGKRKLLTVKHHKLLVKAMPPTTSTAQNEQLRLPSLLERFSNECRKTKTKVITLANQKGRRQSSKPIKTRRNYT